MGFLQDCIFSEELGMSSANSLYLIQLLLSRKRLEGIAFGSNRLKGKACLPLCRWVPKVATTILSSQVCLSLEQVRRFQLVPSLQYTFYCPSNLRSRRLQGRSDRQLMYTQPYSICPAYVKAVLMCTYIRAYLSGFKSDPITTLIFINTTALRCFTQQKAQDRMIGQETKSILKDNHKIEVVDWPKVPQIYNEVIVNLVNGAEQMHGDNQYESSKYIKVKMEQFFKGNWTVIICPKDEKTYNIHYTPAMAPESKYEGLSFTFEKDARRYMIFKCA